MSGQPTEAVIAGSKSFALALLAPLTERVGTRPRIAADPAQALKLTGGSGLVVVEFQGDRSLEAIRALLDQAAGISVIAAVPDGHAGAEEALRSLGVEPARWDGKPDGVLTAVSRRLGGALGAVAPAAQVAVEPPRPEAPPAIRAPAPVATTSRVGALFEDIDLDEAPADQRPPLPHASPLDVAPPPAAVPGVDWPANVSGAAEAAAALAQGLQGTFAPAGSPLAVVAEVMAGMSPLERAVLLGEPQPIDAAPIRRAAVMRVRVAVALASAPKTAGQAPVDSAAVSALLAEIDALLGEVNALVTSAPAELQPSLEQVRNALVKEAIDFSEAAHAAQPAEGPAVVAADAAAAAIARKAAKTRVVSVASRQELEIEKEERRRSLLLVALLGVVALGAGAFHGWRYLAQRQAAAAVPPPLTRAGAPAGARIEKPPGEGVQIVIRSADGNPFSAEEFARMREEEGLRGNTVREAAPGIVIVTPASKGPQGAPPVPAAPGR